MSFPTPYAGGGAFVYYSGPRNFIIGPKLEVRLPWDLSFEVDALHRNLQSSGSFVSSATGVPATPRHLRTHTPWEFPLLGKYRVSALKFHPTFESGLSLRPAGTGTGLSHVGFTAGAGVEMRVKSVNISPVLRYTHWARTFSVPPSRPNQLELLVGFDRPSGTAWPSEFGRKFSFGAIVGVGAGDDFRPASSSFFVEHPESNSLIAGASIEVEIFKQFSLEVDGLYRPLHVTDVPTSASPESRTVRFATLTWEFPVLAKYRFSTAGVRPFLELGPSFRAIGNVEITPPSHYGITGGTGVEFGIGKLKISPTFRFTRWAASGTFGDPNAARTFQNGAQLLLGVSF